MVVQFTIHPTDPEPEPMYAIMPDDDGPGYLVGELTECIALRDALDRLIAQGQHDGTISHLDERLGWTWLGVTEASEQYDIPISTLRNACGSGHIKDAVKVRGHWRFPQATFLYWYHNRPKRGPKPKGKGR